MRIVFFALCFAALLLGQVDTGTVSGTVTDPSGAVIPAARVVVKNLDTNAQAVLETNVSGLYTAPALRPGRYEVTITKEGFQPQKSQPFDLRVQDRAEVNFQLQLGATSSEITVSAVAPLLESETSSLGQVIQDKVVTDLPLNGRNYIQLATLTAGALPSTRTAERDNYISNGARAVQNSYLLDGVDNKNRIMGFDKGSAQIVQPIIDAVQEFKVQTSTFSAEFGQAAGGVVNVTMKSGTNQFHGNLFEFLRNSKMDATPYFQPTGGGKPAFIQNQFGATFGGPIIKDRTLLFRSLAELARAQRSPANRLGADPGDAAGRVFDEDNRPNHQGCVSEQHHSNGPLGSRRRETPDLIPVAQPARQGEQLLLQPQGEGQRRFVQPSHRPSNRQQGFSFREVFANRRPEPTADHAAQPCQRARLYGYYGKVPGDQ